jgi:hypothetical protein
MGELRWRRAITSELLDRSEAEAARTRKLCGSSASAAGTPSSLLIDPASEGSGASDEPELLGAKSWAQWRDGTAAAAVGAMLLFFALVISYD